MLRTSPHVAQVFVQDEEAWQYMCNFCSAFLAALMHNEMQIDEALLGGESGMSPDTTSWRHYQSVRRALGM